MRRILAGAGLVAIAAGAIAQDRTAQGDLSVTIYNNDQALVQDVRQVNLPAGKSRQECPDVSAQIRSETVTLGGEGFGIVEQNFDYDLLSPESLMEKAVGQSVTLLRTNPATGAEARERATVLAVNGGVVLRIGERIEVLRDDGLPVRVIFDAIPPGLRARPTLSVTVDAAKAGPRPLSLSYLTPGLGWKADYVALFDDKAGKIDVQGWITLTNSTGTTFNNANVLLVAGEVGRINQSSSIYRGRGTRPRGNVAGTESGKADRTFGAVLRGRGRNARSHHGNGLGLSQCRSGSKGKRGKAGGGQEQAHRMNSQKQTPTRWVGHGAIAAPNASCVISIGADFRQGAMLAG